MWANADLSYNTILTYTRVSQGPVYVIQSIAKHTTIQKVSTPTRSGYQFIMHC
jgi:hypothetical protein